MRALALIVFLLVVSTAFGQSASEVERRYGKSISVYSVSEHIWMTPDYSADGQVCRMRLYPRRLGQETDYLISQLPHLELVQVLNDIVPPQHRGQKKGGFGLTNLGGGTAWTTYDYENVSFAFIFSYKLLSLISFPLSFAPWRLRGKKVFHFRQAQFYREDARARSNRGVSLFYRK